VARKIQVPSVGGLRKVIAGTAASTATTIAGLEGQSITLQQLALALGTIQTTSSGTSASAAGGAGSSGGASLVVGPGLGGGGPLLGNVPIRLLAPIPFMFGEDGGGDDGTIIPGPPGVNGIIGVNGKPGTTVFIEPEAHDDPVIIPGTPGQNGTNGTAGLPGTTVFIAPDEHDDPVVVPGPPGASGTSGGGSGNVTPDSHPTSPTAYDDEFEGTTLNLSLWAWGNQAGSTAVLAQGACTLTPPVNDSNLHTIEQALPGSGTWAFTTKIFPQIYGQYNTVGMVLRESSSGKLIRFALVDSITTSDFQVDEFNSYSSYNSTLVNGALNDSLRLQTTSSGAYYSGPFYLQLKYDGTNYYYAISTTGYSSQFTQLYSLGQASWFSSAADHIGLFALSQNSSYTPSPAFDWFRKTA
jgi:hypothetical protein